MVDLLLLRETTLQLQRQNISWLCNEKVFLVLLDTRILNLSSKHLWMNNINMIRSHFFKVICFVLAKNILFKKKKIIVMQLNTGSDYRPPKQANKTLFTIQNDESGMNKCLIAIYNWAMGLNILFYHNYR